MNKHASFDGHFYVSMSEKEACELLALLNRGCNTLDPKDWPKWLPGVLDRLEKFSHAKIGGMLDCPAPTPKTAELEKGQTRANVAEGTPFQYAARACGICGVRDIPRHVEWPIWVNGMPTHTRCWIASGGNA